VEARKQEKKPPARRMSHCPERESNESVELVLTTSKTLRFEEALETNKEEHREESEDAMFEREFEDVEGDNEVVMSSVGSS